MVCDGDKVCGGEGGATWCVIDQGCWCAEIIVVKVLLVHRNQCWCVQINDLDVQRPVLSAWIDRFCWNMKTCFVSVYSVPEVCQAVLLVCVYH